MASPQKEENTETAIVVSCPEVSIEKFLNRVSSGILIASILASSAVLLRAIAEIVL